MVTLVVTMHNYCYLSSTTEEFGYGARDKWMVERCASSRDVVYVD
jgi:hypothetical protein